MHSLQLCRNCGKSAICSSWRWLQIHQNMHRPDVRVIQEHRQWLSQLSYWDLDISHELALLMAHIQNQSCVDLKVVRCLGVVQSGSGSSANTVRVCKTHSWSKSSHCHLSQSCCTNVVWVFGHCMLMSTCSVHRPLLYGFNLSNPPIICNDHLVNFASSP